ncbi:hypothetical protein EVA_05617 [gut metagenome]|uniref:Uncharacterized protein n=1 Tax=gut metagenome TaxID=749906 RepID=J9GZC1_9ZZZZ
MRSVFNSSLISEIFSLTSDSFPSSIFVLNFFRKCVLSSVSV